MRSTQRSGSVSCTTSPHCCCRGFVRNPVICEKYELQPAPLHHAARSASPMRPAKWSNINDEIRVRFRTASPAAQADIWRVTMITIDAAVLHCCSSSPLALATGPNFETRCDLTSYPLNNRMIMGTWQAGGPLIARPYRRCLPSFPPLLPGAGSPS